MANENRYFSTPFAENGNKAEVPNVSVGGAVGYDTGFGPDYELTQDNLNAKNIERDLYNGMHNSITKNLKQWQEELYPTWIEDNGSGVAYSYSKGMIVSHSGQSWLSNEGANQEEPGVGSKWKEFNEADNQAFRDSFALKIFQSPTYSGLTEMQTRTVDAGEVYEVRKTSDGEFATIYSDPAGTTEIVQNGTSNVSDSSGVVEFYIDGGEYYIDYNGSTERFIPQYRVSGSKTKTLTISDTLIIDHGFECSTIAVYFEGEKLDESDFIAVGGVVILNELNNGDYTVKTNVDYGSAVTPSRSNNSLNKYGVFTDPAYSRDEGFQRVLSEAVLLADLGINWCVPYYSGWSSGKLNFMLAELRVWKELGVGVMMNIAYTDDPATYLLHAEDFKDVENLVGWYALDEPDLRDIPTTTQNTLIDGLKSLKKIPVICSSVFPKKDTETSQISSKYDYVFMSRYMNSTNVKVDDDDGLAYYTLEGLSHINHKVCPIYETYTKDDDNTDVSNIIPSLKTKFSMYGNERPSIFFNFYSKFLDKYISNTEEFQVAVKQITSSPPMKGTATHLGWYSSNNEEIQYNDKARASQMRELLGGCILIQSECNVDITFSSGSVSFLDSGSLISQIQLDLGEEITRARIEFDWEDAASPNTDVSFIVNYPNRSNGLSSFPAPEFVRLSGTTDADGKATLSDYLYADPTRYLSIRSWTGARTGTGVMSNLSVRAWKSFD